MKIHKQRLLPIKLSNNRFLWLHNYSDNEYTDEMGRWKRMCYYNGLCIGLVMGYVKKEEILEKTPFSICNQFIVQLLFPTSSNESRDINLFDTFEASQKFTESMFKDFKKTHLSLRLL